MLSFLYRAVILTCLSAGVFSSVQGQAWALVNPISGSDEQFGTSTAIDTVSGAIYVTGYFWNNISQFGFSTNGQYDIVLAKYRADGSLNWALQLGSNLSETSVGIATDSSGAVYMTGTFRNTLDLGGLGPSNVISANGNFDAFLAKFDSTGRGLWAVNAGAVGGDRVNGIALHGNNVYFCGGYSGNMNLNGGMNSISPVGSADGYVVQYDTSGTFRWARTIGGTADDEALGITADASGAYVCGFFESASMSIAPSGAPVVLSNAQNGTKDIFLTHLRAVDGLANWGNAAGGSGDDQGHEVAVNGNQLYMVGEFAGTANFGGLGSPVSAGLQDLFIAAFTSSNGAGIWIDTQGSAGGDDIGFGVDANATEVWMTGEYGGNLTWGSSNLLQIGLQDIFVSKYSSAGVHAWSGYAGSTTDDRGASVSLSQDAAWVTGSTNPTSASYFPSAGITIANTGSDDMFLGKIISADQTPSAVNDTVNIFRDSTVIVNVQANDSIPGGNPTSTAVTCPASNGTATVTGIDIQYVPNPGFIGQDSFCYAICVFGAFCDTAMVYINVHPPLPDVLPPPNPTPSRMGSLVIPMDSIYQQDGSNLFNLYAYGLANALLQANIPLKWCIRSGKVLDDIDFSALASRELPGTTPAAVRAFRGGPLVIDSIYADSALIVAAAYNLTVPSPVSVYRLQQNVSIDVRHVLTHKPRIAVFNNGGSQGIHQDYLLNAGFTASHFAIIQPSGAVFDSLACYTFSSEAGWSGATLNDTSETRLVRQFLQYGGNFLAQNTGIGTYEFLEGFQTSGGVLGRPFSQEIYRNPDMPFLQIHGEVANAGGTFASYEPLPGSFFLGGTYSLIRHQGLARYKATARKVTTGVRGGICFYLGGQNYSLADSRNRNARRMYLDAILVPPRRPATCNLDFSSDVQVSKSILPGNYCEGDTVDFLIVVRNGGPGTARDVVVADTLAGGLVYAGSVASQGSYNPGTSLWTVGNVPYQGEDSIVLRAVISNAGNLSNKAFVSVSEYTPDFNRANDTSGVYFTSVTTPDPTITALPSLCDNDTLSPLVAATPGGVWSGTGVSGQDFDPVVSGAGAFTVHYVVSTGPCSAEDSITVAVNPAPVFTLGNDTTLCQGDSVVLDPMLAASSYAWNTTATTPAITVFNSGTYAVTLTDANTCETADTIGVTFAPTPSFTLGNDTTLCQGDSMVLDPMLAASAYAWSTTATTPTITVFTAGTYQVTLTDANNCSAADTIAVTFSPLPVFTLGNDTALCQGDSVILDPMLAALGYAWNTSATTPTITVLTTGTYDLTLTDGNNCSASDTIDVTFNPLPSFTLGNDTSLCQGDSLILDPMLAAVAYSWNTTASTPAITVFNTGIYEVTLTDANNCMASDTVEVTFNLLPVFTLGNDTALCLGDSLILDPMLAASAYAWNTTATTPTITVFTSGSYDVTLTDGNNCSASDTINVTFHPLPSFTLGNDTLLCQGDSVVLDPVLAANSYLWSTAATTPAITVFNNGNYAVTLTDANTCEAADTIQVTFLPPPVINFAGPVSFCPGDSGVLDPNVVAANYLWSTAETTPTITVNAPGWYYVTVTSGSNCQAIDSVNVSLYSLPPVDLGPDTSACQGDFITLSSTFPANAYLWSTSATTATIPVFSTGMYDLEVTDGNNCKARDTINVTFHPLPSFSLGNDTLLCQGDSVVLDPVLAANSYLWSTAATTPTITVFNNGNYAVTLTDANTCEAADTIQVTFLPPPVINFAGPVSFCPGDSGVLDPNVVAANYLWSTAETTPTITVNAPGWYYVTVTSGSNCQAIDSVNVSLYSLPPVDLGPDTSACQGDFITLSSIFPASGYLWSTSATTATIPVFSTGMYDLEVTDGNNCKSRDTINVTFHPLPSFTLGNDTLLCQGDSVVLDPVLAANSYLWSTAATTPTITVFNNGNYAVTLTDANTCEAADTIQVTFLPPPVINFAGPVSFCPGDSGVLDPNVVAANYLWSTAETTPTITVNAPGTYYLTVTTGANCSSVDSVVVSLFSLPNVDLGADTTLCQGDSIGLVSFFGANSYLWSTGATTAGIVVFNSGMYSLTVSNANNCTASDTIGVNFIPGPVFSLGADSILCQGDSLLLDPMLAAQGYLWSNTATTPTITVFHSGSYSVTLTDANNCRGADTVEVTFEALPVPNMGGPHAFCDGDSLNLDAGIAAAAYNWSTGATTPGISVNAAGSYAVTVTTANGCEGSDTSLVSVWALPLVDVSNNPSRLCLDGDPILLNGMPAGGAFSGLGVIGDSLDPSLGVAGNHLISYFFADGNGCSNIDSFQITFIELPLVALTGLAPEYCISDADDSLSLSPAGGSLSGTGTNSPVFSPTTAGSGGPFELIYAYTDSNGCSSADTASTTVRDLPTAADAGPDQTLQGTNLTDLAANVPTNGLGMWSLVSGTATFSDPNHPATLVTELGAGENWLAWTITAGVCGSSSDSILILRNELVIPTGFSPNGDLVNDVYVVRGIDAYSVRRMSVFNRWGSQVYASEQYNNDWAGTNQEGNPLADDTYYLVLDLGEAGQFKQTVAIKR